MDRVQKQKIAKAIVTVDDAIATSGGIAELLGKIITGAVASFFSAPVDIERKKEVDAPAASSDADTEGA